MRKPDEPELRTLCGRKTKVPTQGEKTRLARMLRAAAVPATVGAGSDLDV